MAQFKIILTDEQIEKLSFLIASNIEKNIQPAIDKAMENKQEQTVIHLVQQKESYQNILDLLLLGEVI